VACVGWMSNCGHEVGEDGIEVDPNGRNGAGDDRRDRRQEQRVLRRRCAMIIGDPIEPGVQTQQQPSHYSPLLPLDDSLTALGGRALTES
jgi:hypothetical protein